MKILQELPITHHPFCASLYISNPVYVSHLISTGLCYYYFEKTEA